MQHALGHDLKVPLAGHISAAVALAHGTPRPYIGLVRGNSDYGDKRTRNTRIGPGGGTRRLHQYSLIGGGGGRNRIDERLKGPAFAR